MDAINWHSFFFLLCAAIACTFAVAVVIASNIVRMACFLVISLTAVAGLFFLAGADFLGAAQLMVYVGGTLVLIIFGVMLTARGPFVSMRTGAAQWIVALVAGGALLAVLLQAAVTIPAWAGPSADQSQPTAIAPTAEQLGYGLLGVRIDQLGQQDAAARGSLSGYLLPFEIISIHLVVVLVGAAYLARARRRVSRLSQENRGQ